MNRCNRCLSSSFQSNLFATGNGLNNDFGHDFLKSWPFSMLLQKFTLIKKIFVFCEFQIFMVTLSSEDKVTEYTLFFNLEITLIKKLAHFTSIIYLVDGVAQNSSE